jgi:Icc-related predicted phosphoesterase
MQIDYISDIHMDTWDDDLNWKKTKKSDHLIIAGDVADKYDDIKYTLKTLGNLYQKIYYVDGNHEYATMRFAYQEQKDNLRNICKELKNVHFLPDNPVIINDIGIVGACGWWTFDFSGCDARFCIEWLSANSKTWHEFEHIKYKVDSDLIYYFFNKLAINDYNSLKDHIKNIYNRVNKLIVVTHTSCNPQTSVNTYPTGEDIRGLYGNSYMMNLVAQYKKIKYWINGHCHTKKCVDQYDVKFINNPRGRPWDCSSENYKIDTLFT